ncbi:DUF4062 domain-containing protein [Methanoregula sp.]|uniref:DUF4062 domain-containing protein n=1 Tax=Methanoregula sp. TaxID=2052170 RepID=UPI003C43BA8C
MAKKKLSIFISSRNRDNITYQNRGSTLSEIRGVLKTQLESEQLFEKDIFEVWINEDEPPVDGTEDSWDKCMSEVREADIVLCIYNGNAGWTKNPGEIGICHAELKTALESEPNKVRLVETTIVEKNPDAAQEVRNKKFQKYKEELNLFRGAEALSGEAIIARSLHAVKDAVVEMAYAGRLNPNKSSFFLGDSLKWSRMGYPERKKAIEQSILTSLAQRKERILDDHRAIIKNGNQRILLNCQAIPDSLSVSEAKELVGQPFLFDHEDYQHLDELKAIGPIHLIGCHKSITESQARKILGFPDATIVKAPFGIYVADNVQMIQLIFLQDCRNETETVHVLQRFLDWLEKSGEVDFLIERAEKRKKIVKAISEVQPTP